MGKASKKKRAATDGSRTKETGSQGSVTRKPEEGFQKSPGKTSLPLVIILAVSFAVYFNALPNDFVYDDMTQVLENPWIKDVRYLPDIFLKSVWSFTGEVSSNYYRPLMHVVSMINYHIFGLKPWGFHLVNVLFHVGNSALVFLLASRLLGGHAASEQACKRTSLQAGKPASALASLLSAPFAAAILFATHPIHTEAVTWIAGFPDVSFTFFFLLSFYFYVRSTAEKQVHAWLYSLSVVSFFLAALCKEPALTLPVILMAYDLSLRKSFRGREIPLTPSLSEGEQDAPPGKVGPGGYLKIYLPYFIVAGIYLALRYHALGGVAPAVKRHAYLSAWQYLINVFPLFMQYIEKLLLPVNLNAFYVFHPVLSLFEVRGIIALIVTAVFVLSVFIALKKYRTVLLGLLIIAVPLLPVLYIPGVGDNTFTDRYLYLPSFGFVLLVSLALIRLKAIPKGAALAAFLLVVITALYSAGTIARNYLWKDNYVLFPDTVKKSPDGSIAHNMLGMALAKAGRVNEAIEEFRVSVELDPDHATANSNLGFAYMESGQIDKAVKHLETAVRREPGNVLYRNNLAYARSLLGSAAATADQLDKAVEHYRTLVTSQPDNAMYRNLLGIAYGQKGLYAEAVGQFREAVRLAPEEPSYRKNLERASGIKNPDRGKK